MNDGNVEAKITQYLKENPQHMDGNQAYALAGDFYFRDKQDNIPDLAKAGFIAQKGQHGYVVSNAIISPSWRTGGTTGGSWQGGTSNVPLDAEDRPAWLEEIFEQVMPEITFLKFRKLQRKVVDHSYTVNEYYGNSTVYAFQTLKVSDILDVLDA